MDKKIKVLFISNFSKALTGFGKNIKNILIILHNDPQIEVIEAANGAAFGADLRTPWKSYGTYPNEPKVLQEIKSNPQKDRLAQYGNYTIDKIIQLEKPDIVIGVEDVWAFDWAKKPWIGKIGSVIWTTLDSLPILDQAYSIAPKVDKFLVWASFAEKEMKKQGYEVETLHGAIDYSGFKSLPEKERLDLRAKFGLTDNFITGFVFKNQLRKSVPNLLEGFKLFKKDNPEAKLLLHTDWKQEENTWDIPKYIKEKEIDNDDILSTYICRKCKNYLIHPYQGEEKDCPICKSEKSLVTKSNMFGVTEDQLNEIYNIMDVYCHPFTSGGQEIPIQEAKAAGLITLVTEYSCGTDCCYEKDGGIPLDWVEYREPFTQFIKSTTLPESIAANLQRVKNMPQEEKDILLENGRRCIEEKFSVDKIVGRLKEIILEIGPTDWDFNFEEKEPNIKFIPSLDERDGVSPEDWLIELYFEIFNKRLKLKDVEVKDGSELIKKEGREGVYQFLLNKANEKIKAKRQNQSKKLEDYFDGEDEKRISIVMPESAGDVLIVNSLITNFKKLYPEYNLYFITQLQYFSMIDDHPDIHKIIPYQNGMDNVLMMEGQGEHKGYFDMCFVPFALTQRFLGYLRNGLDKDNFNLFSEIK